MKKLPPLSQSVTNSRYVTFGDPGRSRLPLKVLLAGRESCLPGYRVQRAGFAGYGVEFVSEGIGQVVLDGKNFPLHAGVLFCYGPKTAHDISSDSERPLTKYFLDFTGALPLRFLRRNGLPPGTAVQVTDIEPTRFYFEQMINWQDSGGRTDLEHALHCMSLIVLGARRALNPAKASGSSESFSLWRAFLEENYLRIQNLEQMATELHTRPSQICRVFQQFGHPRPFQLLTRKKLNRAVELLVGERWSVQAAAQAVGYEDPYHFSRLFKQHFGRSPANFLKHAGRSSGRREETGDSKG